MTSQEIFDKLIGMGCHSTDISDAFEQQIRFGLSDRDLERYDDALLAS